VFESLDMEAQMTFKVPSPRVMIAFVIAAIADLIQITFWPVTVEGALSPVNNVIDIVVGAILVWLLGWHWALLPSFLGEMVPGADLCPFWTAAVFIAGMGEQVKPTGTPGAPGQPTISGPEHNALPGAMPSLPPASSSNPHQPIDTSAIHWIKP